MRAGVTRRCRGLPVGVSVGLTPGWRGLLTGAGEVEGKKARWQPSRALLDTGSGPDALQPSSTSRLLARPSEACSLTFSASSGLIANIRRRTRARPARRRRDSLQLRR